MGINMELMRKKLAALRGEGRGDGKVSAFFKPDEGDQTIRMVTPKDGDPLKELFFHYNVGNHRGGIMCPKRNFGERCPICEFASQLWREGTENNDEESKKLAKSLFVRTRFFSPVVVRGREEEGIKVYGYGKKAYELLLGYILDPPDVMSLFERQTPEQIDAILDEQLSSGGSAENRSSETTKYAKTDDKSNIDKVFDELLAS
jgi:hypothetical protein